MSPISSRVIFALLAFTIHPNALPELKLDFYTCLVTLLVFVMNSNVSKHEVYIPSSLLLYTIQRAERGFTIGKCHYIYGGITLPLIPFYG